MTSDGGTAMKRQLLLVVLASLLVSQGFAQPDSTHWNSSRNRDHRGSSFGFFPGIGRSDVFPGRGFRSNIGIFPVVRLPRDFASLYFADRFLFGRHETTRVGRPFDLNLYDSSYGYYGGWYPYAHYGPTPALYDSRQFIEEWKNRPPERKEEPVSTQSILLQAGMGEEEVVRAVGIPLQKVVLGERVVWRYSAYSLLFENGTLKEIR
jgi:hypothetical protein